MIKKAAVIAMTVFLLLGGSFGFAQKSSTDGNFETDGKGLITGYKGTPPVKLVIPDKIGKEKIIGIGKNAFRGAESIQELKLPKTLVLIDNYAFILCRNIKSLDLSRCGKLEKIGDGAFSDCNGIGMLALPANLAEMGEEVFAYCESIPDINLSKCTELKTIAIRAFFGCTNAIITLPKSIEAIGEDAFGNEMYMDSSNNAEDSESNSEGKVYNYTCKEVRVPKAKVSLVTEEPCNFGGKVTPY
ncbi:leucine-rich repeat domain-containing protein [Treponema phagedenis]|uniref:Leucine-rich repeat domain-containing protein n=2 Tax=Treponema phagedenis TaxID=162 RepID=A0A0B7GWZ0_TREPH|nr:leucine-rich repeat domain-containing protein [Treponema phagedenis]EFW36832.1 hypothetical protein HMPREF9554_02691 [Treponema phagedenis F0421]QEJ99391.1 leucine-rich repeat domain-containing protein [Treponema phagedenis]QEK04962.1 leucine-rich repeat domain-containing protein [Treponema phagedenis]QEK07419.1 leucine-rich repeat domain-containing protein [Treponema phagedenis]QEK10583.1 leucine-rich repeat domain-containing protein [Treponema phagedenis]